MDKLFHAIEGLSSLPELWRLMIGFYRDRGFGGVAYFVPRLVGEGQPGGLTVVEHGFPRDLVASYVQGGLAEHDPLPAVALETGRAIRFSSVPETLNLNDNEMRYWALVRESGMTDGYAFPTYGPQSRNAYVAIGMVRDAEVLDGANVLALHMAAQAAHLKICFLTPDPQALDRPLSQREREILEWVARGKSNSVIAEILQLSPGTVDTYLRRIYEKLNVSDRTSAAVKGVGMGIIVAG